MLINTYNERIGNTQLVRINSFQNKNINVYAKLEGSNPSGSIKDRSAAYVIEKLLKEKIIKPDTTIVESSSGNFGIALASYLKTKNMNFVCVIDPKTTECNYKILSKLCKNIIVADKMDECGGYLLERIKIVKEYVATHENSYWINQYTNVYMKDAYYHTVAEEIVHELNKIDYAFIAVSSGGTISGISTRLKDENPNIKIIAVDVEGSIIFGQKPKKRNIPGIGSSQVPDILKYAKIDEVVIVNEKESIECCNKLIEEDLILAGGSSGSLYAAIKKYFAGKEFDKPINVVTVFPDKGDRYMGIIY